MSNRTPSVPQSGTFGDRRARGRGLVCSMVSNAVSACYTNGWRIAASAVNKDTGEVIIYAPPAGREMLTQRLTELTQEMVRLNENAASYGTGVAGHTVEVEHRTDNTRRAGRDHMLITSLDRVTPPEPPASPEPCVAELAAQAAATRCVPTAADVAEMRALVADGLCL